jgi:hypothetical protein
MLIVRAVRVLWRENRVSRLFLGITALTVGWPWLSAAGLLIALLLLPTSMVQSAWRLPLLTSLAIPVIVVAVLLAGRKTFCSAEG